MLSLTRDTIDAWVEARRARGDVGPVLVKLEAGDRMDIKLHSRGISNTAVGPALIELTVYRDGGWDVREMTYETPGTIYWETS